MAIIMLKCFLIVPTFIWMKRQTPKQAKISKTLTHFNGLYGTVGYWNYYHLSDISKTAVLADNRTEKTKDTNMLGKFYYCWQYYNLTQWSVNRQIILGIRHYLRFLTLSCVRSTVRQCCVRPSHNRNGHILTCYKKFNNFKHKMAL